MPTATEEPIMSTQANTDAATQAAVVPAAAPAKLEVTTLPVADVDRAKAFYQRLGWRLDIDFEPTPEIRGVQFTPPGSPASIQFGKGSTTMTPGPAGPDPGRRRHRGRPRRTWSAGASRSARSGTWSPARAASPASTRSAARTSAEPPSRTPTATVGLQEITERLPGRVEPTDFAALAQLLLETATATGRSRPSPRRTTGGTGTRAYLGARQAGSTAGAGHRGRRPLHGGGKHGVVVSR